MKLTSRYAVFHGSVEAHGMFFAFDSISRNSTAQNVFDVWQSGLRIFQTQKGIVVFFPQPIRIESHRARGIPLVKQNECFVGFPTDVATLIAINATPGQVIVFDHGMILQMVPDRPVDPSLWLDVSQFEMLESSPLGLVQAVVPELKPATVERSLFSGVPDMSADAKLILDQFKSGNATSGLREADVPRAADVAGAGRREAAAAIRSTIERFLGIMLSSVLSTRARLANGGAMETRSKAGNGRGSAPAAGKNNGAPVEQRQSKLALQAEALLTTMLSMIGVLPFLRAKQAAYLNKMMDSLTRGNWDEALRYAIPLASDSSPDESPADSLRVPAPRTSLDIKLSPRTSQNSLGLDSEFVEHLRFLYRRAFEQLDQAGKVDEAAFVLAELLQASEEAVSYLERHGKFALAAQVAEARNLRPELVVRLLLLARKTEKAVAVARLRNCFSEAVTMLDVDNWQLALLLRAHWANSLAAAGNYAAAIEVVWDIPDYEALCHAWLKLAFQTTDGAGTTGRLLARYLYKFPFDETYEILKPHVEALLSDRSSERSSSRSDFLTTLIACAKSPYRPLAANQILLSCARQATRGVLRDLAAGYISVSKNQLKEITATTQDRMLWADLSGARMPALKTKLSEHPTPLRYEITGYGTKVLTDCAFLPNGKSLVACGEAGVLLLNAAGNITHRFKSPAFDLVISSSGNLALAVARRGDAAQIARLDLIRKTERDLGHTLISSFAREYDGSKWVVHGPDGLLIVDATADSCKVLWRLSDIRDNVVDIASNQNSCSFIRCELCDRDAFGRPVKPKVTFEGYTCDSSDLQLRSKLKLQVGDDGIKRCNAAGKFFVAKFYDDSAGDLRQILIYCDNIELQAMFVSAAPECKTSDLGLVASANWLASSVPVVGGIDWIIRSISHTWRGLTIHLKDARRSSVRIDEDIVTICDDLGRLVVVELEFGSLLRNIRVT